MNYETNHLSSNIFHQTQHSVDEGESGVSHYVLCLNEKSFHHMHYKTFGRIENPIIIMVHGLTRNCGEFTQLAMALAHEYFVICPDIVGRGDSDCLPLDVDYTYSQYLMDLTTLMAQVQGQQDLVLNKKNKQCDESNSTKKNVCKHNSPVIWLGSSMGGLLGMILASLNNSCISKLILNDIGPFIPYALMQKIRDTLSTIPVFTTFEQAISYIKLIYSGLGTLSEEEWIHVTQSMIKVQGDHFVLHYDPRITKLPVQSDIKRVQSLSQKDHQMNEPSANTEHLHHPRGRDVDFWKYWEAIHCPILTIRGKESMVLTNDLLQKMKASKGSSLTYVEVENAAHTPALFKDDMIECIMKFLNT